MDSRGFPALWADEEYSTYLDKEFIRRGQGKSAELFGRSSRWGGCLLDCRQPHPSGLARFRYDAGGLHHQFRQRHRTGVCGGQRPNQ